LDDVVKVLRKRRATTQAALVEYMKDRESAMFPEVASRVHGDDQTSDEAIRKNVDRANDALIERGVPIRFRTAAGHVWKDSLPS
jgi:hypothetical protein